MNIKREVIIRYRLVTGKVIEVSVSEEVAAVFDDVKRQKKKHSMRQLRHGSNAEMEKVLTIRSAALLTEATPGVEDAILMNELSDTLLSAMDTLSTTQKRRLFLRFFMDYSLVEIAQLENVAPQSVTQSVTIALKKLKKQIQLEDDTL